MSLCIVCENENARFCVTFLDDRSTFEIGMDCLADFEQVATMFKIDAVITVPARV